MLTTAKIEESLERLAILQNLIRSRGSPEQNLQEKLSHAGQILDKCTPATLQVEYINVNFLQDEFKDDSTHMQLTCNNLLFPFSTTPVITVPLQDAKILYDGRASSKKFVELSMNVADIIKYSFCPGDTIGVLVSNSNKDVESVLISLQLAKSADDLCEISIKPRTTKKNVKVPQHIAQHSSVRAILRDCLDLRSVPKKLFLRSLAEYTADEDEKAFLISVSSKEGSKLYNEIILEKPQTFLDILNLCPSCCPPFSLLIEHLPRLKPRPYSIANSPLTEEGKVKIIFSVLPENPGVATSYLTELAEKFVENPESPPEINFFFRERNKFSYDVENAADNSILIAIGCGVSPYLGFLEHKEYLFKQKNVDLGSTWLFVGSTCQNSAVYREQLIDYKRNGVLQELFESFSRDAECNKFKHVQDQLEENAKKFVLELIKKETILYVCADGTKISKNIENCIKKCFVQVLQCSEEQAEEFIKESRTSGKYREDIWV